MVKDRAAKKQSRYRALIEKIFLDRYQKGATCIRRTPHRRDIGLAPSSCRLPLKGGVVRTRFAMRGGVVC